MIYQIEILAIIKKDRSNSRSVAISSCDPFMDPFMDQARRQYLRALGQLGTGQNPAPSSQPPLDDQQQQSPLQPQTNMVLERDGSQVFLEIPYRRFLRKRHDISIFPGTGQTLFTGGGVQDSFYREGDQASKLSQQPLWKTIGSSSLCGIESRQQFVGALFSCLQDFRAIPQRQRLSQCSSSQFLLWARPHDYVMVRQPKRW